MNHINFTNFPKIETNRLILRKLSTQDSKAVFSLRSDGLNRKYLDSSLDPDIEASKHFIKKIVAGVEKNEWIYWAIDLKDSNQFIGTICIWNFSEDKFEGELGYELASNFQGKGYMSEALEVVINYAFKNLHFNQLNAFTNHQNQSSVKLLEKNQFLFQKNIEEIHSKTKEPYFTSVFSLKNPSL